ncbi:MAG TPA: DCC1-like thiol-disulfide oxidoreductase family protein [Ramlibacter sp.]|uniref:thiol-disulfide oxidoreductase DCC family protein n=1 Tax=Ramlibacter sp. TaxID=1917967 RepID=UPI002ED45A8F
MIVVFDAHCLVCSGWVRFLLRRRGGQHIRFASVQGPTGRSLLLQAGLQPDALQTLLVLDRGRSWQNTAAILRVLDALGWPWKLAWAGWIVPAPWRDGAYRWAATRRYRLFGRSDACMLPPEGSAHRFLD